MLTFVLYFSIACFVGLAILGHILVLQALFTSADYADGKRRSRKARGRGILPNVPV
ncbi:hypothetical protein [Pseudorhodoplanes sp.]|uniref:hypothetical protein n=1 Tax=Pseudorhodoplanes sp. TaxID=1934341 RepID=UPI002BE1D246|nr:hypothetical protein [Pseudorhodoplanes sp.]HWV55665.1 hypothetical protein [Pseudorhodoplanes sp.]